jgi:hypothetical protein
MLVLDGVYIELPDGSLRFRWVRAPTSAELAGLTQTLARRVGRFLERQGLLERDAENSYLAGDMLEAGPMEQFLGSSMMCMDVRMSRAQDAQERPPIASPSGHSRVARCSPCRRYHRAMSRWMPGSARWRDSPRPRAPSLDASRRITLCTPVWRRGRINAKSSRGCAGISAGPPSRKIASH